MTLIVTPNGIKEIQSEDDVMPTAQVVTPMMTTVVRRPDRRPRTSMPLEVLEGAQLIPSPPFDPRLTEH